MNEVEVGLGRSDRSADNPLWRYAAFRQTLTSNEEEEIRFSVAKVCKWITRKEYKYNKQCEWPKISAVTRRSAIQWAKQQLSQSLQSRLEEHELSAYLNELLKLQHQKNFMNAEAGSSSSDESQTEKIALDVHEIPNSPLDVREQPATSRFIHYTGSVGVETLQTILAETDSRPDSTVARQESPILGTGNSERAKHEDAQDPPARANVEHRPQQENHSLSSPTLQQAMKQRSLSRQPPQDFAIFDDGHDQSTLQTFDQSSKPQTNYPLELPAAAVGQKRNSKRDVLKMENQVRRLTADLHRVTNDLQSVFQENQTLRSQCRDLKETHDHDLQLVNREREKTLKKVEEARRFIGMKEALEQEVQRKSNSIVATKAALVATKEQKLQILSKLTQTEAILKRKDRELLEQAGTIEEQSHRLGEYYSQATSNQETKNAMFDEKSKLESNMNDHSPQSPNSTREQLEERLSRSETILSQVLQEKSSLEQQVQALLAQKRTMATNFDAHQSTNDEMLELLEMKAARIEFLQDSHNFLQRIHLREPDVVELQERVHEVTCQNQLLERQLEEVLQASTTMKETLSFLSRKFINTEEVINELEADLNALDNSGSADKMGKMIMDTLVKLNKADGMLLKQ